MNNYPIYNDIGIEKHKIASYQMDLKGKATLPVFCNLFQEIAGNHAEANGFGFPQMYKEGHIWVLTRMKIEVDKYPRWNEEVYVKTWVRNRENHFSERAFVLLDKNENKIAGALSGWMLLDLKTRRPKSIQHLSLDIQMFPDNKVVQTELNKISSIQRIDSESLKEVLFDDIDVNQHVNNVKYIEWILASFPYSFRKTHNISEFEINYAAELKYGETAEIRTEQINETSYRCAVFNKDNKEVCRAELKWEKL